MILLNVLESIILLLLLACLSGLLTDWDTALGSTA